MWQIEKLIYKHVHIKYIFIKNEKKKKTEFDGFTYVLE